MATYIRLTDYKDSDSKEQGFFKSENRYEAKQDDFKKIPGSPIAYWVSDRVQNIFDTSEKLNTLAEPRAGLQTGENEKFVRQWSEIDFKLLGFGYDSTNATIDKLFKWFPYNKGGEYKKFVLF